MQASHINPNSKICQEEKCHPVVTIALKEHKEENRFSCPSSLITSKVNRPEMDEIGGRTVRELSFGHFPKHISSHSVLLFYKVLNFSPYVIHSVMAYLIRHIDPRVFLRFRTLTARSGIESRILDLEQRGLDTEFFHYMKGLSFSYKTNISHTKDCILHYWECKLTRCSLGPKPRWRSRIDGKKGRAFSCERPMPNFDGAAFRVQLGRKTIFFECHDKSGSNLVALERTTSDGSFGWWARSSKRHLKRQSPGIVRSDS